MRTDLKPFLKVSLSNLAGFVIGIWFVALLTFADQSEGGYLWPYFGTLARWTHTFLGPVQFSVVMGAVLALIVSFAVSHVIEKL